MTKTMKKQEAIDTKIPEEMQVKIDSTFTSGAFPNLIPEQVVLLQKMFDTVYICGINRGLEEGKQVFINTLNQIKK